MLKMCVEAATQAQHRKCGLHPYMQSQACVSLQHTMASTHLVMHCSLNYFFACGECHLQSAQDFVSENGIH